MCGSSKYSLEYGACLCSLFFFFFYFFFIYDPINCYFTLVKSSPKILFCVSDRSLCLACESSVQRPSRTLSSIAVGAGRRGGELSSSPSDGGRALHCADGRRRRRRKFGNGPFKRLWASSVYVVARGHRHLPILMAVRSPLTRLFIVR